MDPGALMLLGLGLGAIEGAIRMLNAKTPEERDAILQESEARHRVAVARLIAWQNRGGGTAGG